MLIESLVLSYVIFTINFISLPQIIKEGNLVKHFLSKSRITAGLFGVFIGASLYFSITPLAWFIIDLLFARGLIIIFEAFSRFLKLERASSGKYTLAPKERVTLGKQLVAALIISMILLPSAMIYLSIDRSVANAQYFHSQITIIENRPFLKTEVPPEMMRLVTPELAKSIAEQHLSSFGSNMEVKGVHISIINNTLVWVAAIGSTNTFAENYIQGIVIVKASDPLAEPILIKMRFNIGEGLFLFNEIHLHSYEMNPVNGYGIAYITQDPDGNWVYVVTQYTIGSDLISYPSGVIVYNPDGSVRNTYSIDKVPDWIPQMYDEAWLEEKISQWGEYRRGNSFDIFAGGFLWIEPSRDRVEISEDLRYIQSPDTGKMVGIVTVHPTTSDRTLAGVFLLNHTGIYYYDYRSLNYISGRSAIDYVTGRLVKPAQGFYYGTMPLLYAIKVNDQIRMAWFVPIYWAQYSEEEERTTLIRFAGLGIVDAADPSYIAVNLDIQGKTGPEVVVDTINQFKALFGAAPQQNVIDIYANVTGVYQYTINGMTHVVLELDNSTYHFIEGTPDILPPAQWYELLATKVGDKIHARLRQTDDGRWIIVEFDNLNI
ncbi:MAG: hypothetical protein ACP6IS_06945 [Candidatus Asgardarchaeia archaeon]